MTFRSFFCGAILATIAVGLSGCASFPSMNKEEAPVAQPRRWFLDPSSELANYKTYGFLQVTAVRYQDPIEKDPKKKSKRSRVERMTGQNKEKDAPIEIQHTDELIWRILQDEMARKGYAQVNPTDADLWVIYYGGPRPIMPMSQLRIKSHPFDQYFAQNELTEDTFFVDIIDAKTQSLIYRGWDVNTFRREVTPEPDAAITAVQEAISFFPGKKVW